MMKTFDFLWKGLVHNFHVFFMSPLKWSTKDRMVLQMPSQKFTLYIIATL